MDWRRYKFPFANGTYLSTLCDVFEEHVLKSYLPAGVEAIRNLTFMAGPCPPYSLYARQPGTKLHLTGGPLFLIIKEVSKKLQAKLNKNYY